VSRALDAVLRARLDDIEASGLARVDRPTNAPGSDLSSSLIACSNLYLHAHGDAYGAGASRLVSGTRTAHHAAEHTIAAWLRCEASLLFSNGYAANVGAIPALAIAGDAVFSDALNHASIVDGVRLSRAARHVYPHLDLTALDAALAACVAPGARWVITESVFSMDGDVAPLAELVALCRRHGAYLYIDEAHALGVCGESGRGAACAAGVADGVDVLVGTLGKAFAGFGAFAAGSSTLRAYLANTARTFIFSTALPEEVVRRSLEALSDVAGGGAQARLLERTQQLGALLEAAGWWRGPATTAIFPLVAGDPTVAVAWRDALLVRGFFVQAIRPPTVPQGTSRLRVTVSAAYEPADVTALAEAIVATATSLGITPRPVQDVTGH